MINLGALSGSSPHKWGIQVGRSMMIHSTRFIPTQVGNTGPLQKFLVKRPVHPHTSGEYFTDGQPEMDSTRFIPTQVGNTFASTAISFAGAVHPHTSGEYAYNKYDKLIHFGSSPHKWGIRSIPSERRYRVRYIPTQVGNTNTSDFPPPLFPVHPHTSGEYSGPIKSAYVIFGSSPHKWGIPNLVSSHLGFIRFIPTQVGNTADDWNFCGVFSVHPHTSGEYFMARPCFSAASGSSPHKWGILFREVSKRMLLRFIPTQVGNTSAVTGRHTRFSVHPHTSGEYSRSSGLLSIIGGSSPHKWGIRLVAPKPLRNLRFIPTQVGNTHQSPAPNRYPPVHPHTSGEYLTASTISSFASGSSPHKWGIRRRVRVPLTCFRFIPTQVGNTRSPLPSVATSLVHPHTSGEYSSRISLLLNLPWFIPTQVGNTGYSCY